MPVRLNVLVLRPAGSGSGFHEQCDDVIGQLLGRPGLDVTLLERLPSAPSVDDYGTERLALESLGGHLACLAWSEPETFQTAMAVAGKPMNRRPHQHDPHSEDATDESSDDPDTVVGRMFFFDMRQPAISEDIFASLQNLLKKLQTPMFQIQPVGKSKRIQPALSGGNAKQNESMVQASRAESPDVRDSSSPSNAKGELVQHNRNESEGEPVTSTNDDLDRLVDELDELNL